MDGCMDGKCTDFKLSILVVSVQHYLHCFCVCHFFVNSSFGRFWITWRRTVDVTHLAIGTFTFTASIPLSDTYVVTIPITITARSAVYMIEHISVTASRNR